MYAASTICCLLWEILLHGFFINRTVLLLVVDVDVRTRCSASQLAVEVVDGDGGVLEDFLSEGASKSVGEIDSKIAVVHVGFRCLVGACCGEHQHIGNPCECLSPLAIPFKPPNNFQRNVSNNSKPISKPSTLN